MCQSAKRKGVLIRVAALAQQFKNEISATDVVHQVAEFRAAEGVVAQVLNDGASIREACASLSWSTDNLGKRLSSRGWILSVHTRSTMAS
jgi:hypothetical protein